VLAAVAVDVGEVALLEALACFSAQLGHRPPPRRSG
jgi:hypothetical protein